jgi:four helix bundle protein
MKKFRFRQFKIYKDLRVFRHELKTNVKKNFPREEQFGLTSQLLRAIDSSILNIAGGSDRGTDKEFARYLNIAHTSLNEVVACLDLALDDTYITEADHEIFLKKIEDLANQLTAFRKSIINS